MTYSPNIPIASIPPKDQVMQIMTNFVQFAAIYSTTVGAVKLNHTALNAANQGDHECLLMELQTIDPGVTQDLCVIYSKNAISNSGTQPQLFYQMPVFLPNSLDPLTISNTPMQLTYNTVNTAGPQYQSFVAGGFLVYWGTATSTGTITLSPAPTKILLALANPNNFTTPGVPIPVNVSTNVLNNSQFSINSTLAVGGNTFTWLALAQA